MAVSTRTRAVAAITAGVVALVGVVLLLLMTSGGEAGQARPSGLASDAAPDGTAPTSRARLAGPPIHVVPFAASRAAEAGDEIDADTDAGAFLLGQLQIRGVPEWRGTLTASLRSSGESSRVGFMPPPETAPAPREIATALTEAPFSVSVPKRGTYACVFRADGVKNTLRTERGTGQTYPIPTALLEAVTVDATKFGPGITAVRELDSGNAAESAGDGVWRLPGPWFVPVTVVLELGSPETTVTVRTTTDSATIRLAAPTCTLMRVCAVDVATQRPIAGASVVSELFLQGLMQTLRATTGADGCADAALPGAGGPFTGRIVADGYETVTIGQAGALSLQRGPQPARIEMAPTGSLGGHVIGADGLGVAHARVLIVGASKGSLLLGGTTDATGAFRLRPGSFVGGIVGGAGRPWGWESAAAEPLACTVAADAEGLFGPVDWNSIASGSFVINTGPAYRDWDALVRDDAGHPIAGARAWVAPFFEGHALLNHERPATRPSDEAGRLRLPPVYGSHWHVRVEAPDHAQFDTVASPEAGPVPVVLDGTRLLRLQFLLDDGRPAQRVVVSAWRIDAEGTALPGAVVCQRGTDASGRVNVSMDGPGSAGYSCPLLGDRMLSLHAPTRVPIGADRVTIIPMCGARSVHVRCTPLSGVATAAYVEATASPPEQQPAAPIGQLIFDAGDIRLPGEEVLLAAYAMGAMPQVLRLGVAHLPDPATVVVTWEPGPRVRGRLVRGGSPLAHQAMVLRLVSPELPRLPDRVLMARAKTDADGRFDVLVRPGSYDITVGDAGQPVRRGLFVDRDAEVPDIECQ